jgi:hypothetical protein
MLRFLLALTLFLAPLSRAGVDVDIDAFGESLGGWAKGGSTVDYALSGANYRTYKPEITPTPDGGIFVSVRIDHRRGWLASDDHAVLEVTFGSDGSVESAQSSLAIQGRTIASELIRGGANAGARVTGVEGAVKIGTDLVADLSSKLLREKIVEAGRVSYPAALRHNYNLLFQAVKRVEAARVIPVGQEEVPEADATEAAEQREEPKPPTAKPLEIQPYGAGGKKK